MTGIETAIIGGVIKFLIKFGTEEISLIRGLDKDTLQLKTTLVLLESYLIDADKKLITQESVKAWLRELVDVAFRADDTLDELNYHILGSKVRKMKTMKDRVSSSFPSYHRILRPSNMARTIQKINNDFESLNRKAAGLGLESLLVNAQDAALPDPAFETDSFTVDPIFIGRDEDVSQLADVLIHCPEEMKLSVLSIVGMGGMGKTTLTRRVFNHQSIKAKFGATMWVHVSQAFDPIIVLKKILASLTEGTHDVVQTRQVTLAKLQEALKAKRYLLVLDDVWNQDQDKWENFVNSLWGVTPLNGNCIVLTTRSTRVASVVKPFHTHCLNGLSVDDCWSIIKVKAFGKGSDVPSEYESVGRKIATRCQGLPLAANIVGAVLRGKSEHEWVSIQHNWLPDDEGDSISKILRLSFDNLPLPSLKNCFAFCSVFPKGDTIVKQRLIELWMAEGFLQPDRRNEMEIVGEKFVDMLVHSSLLQEVVSEYGDRVVYYGMHDLVHDLAASFSVDDNGINQVRYMSGSSPITKEAAKYLRTLFFHGAISDIKFSDFKCLHTLTLTNREVRELPSSISKLIHLRELNIQKTEISYLPDSIGELHHLQTLRAGLHTSELPRTLKYLISLRHLYFFHSRVKSSPPEIGRLTCLQTLPCFYVGSKKGCRIEELGSLKNLKGKLRIDHLEKVHSKDEAEKANISKNPNIFELVFCWSESRSERERNDESVLEGLEPHPNLKVFEIKDFQGKRFPLWTLKMAVRDETTGSWVELNKLTKIDLDCPKCEEIPKLGHLPNLKYLYLRGFSNVLSINSSSYGIENETDIAFPALEELTLQGMLELREWGAKVEAGSIAFPHLRGCVFIIARN